ncbi:MAG: phosphatase PAP2 family protein [Bacteriovorax sp.]|jgi:membrane-associated phospholipid phosphatase
MNKATERIFSLPDRERAITIALYGFIATFFFTSIYGYCNWHASLSPERIPMYADWELAIPIVPWMIFPYISLNLLFLFAFFVIDDVKAIKGLCLALSISAVIAGIIFYFFPGELGYKRQVVSGYESLFNFMFSIDHPHNLFPSLHITYSSLTIWSMRHLKSGKMVRIFFDCWLLLITASVVLVHQHHLFDIATGFFLAVLVHFGFVKRYFLVSKYEQYF